MYRFYKRSFVKSVVASFQSVPRFRADALPATMAALTPDEIAACCEFLRRSGPPAGCTESQWLALNNNLLNLLRQQEPVPPELVATLAETMTDPSVNPVMRDYAVQHASTLRGRLSRAASLSAAPEEGRAIAPRAPSEGVAPSTPPAVHQIEEALWAVTVEREGTVAGTALLALSRWDRSGTLGVEGRERLGETALAVLGRIGLGRGEPPARPSAAAADDPAGRPYLILVAGICFGLMFATKATAVISFIAWSGAALFTWGWPKKTTVYRLLGAAAIGLAVAAWLYTDGGRYPGAVVDMVRSFGVYHNDPGHDKPAGYYFQLLLWPKYRGGFWWTEAGVGVLALVGAGRAWATGPAGRWGRFLTWSVFAHWSAYLLIAYKTPWLMVVPWLHVVLLAGYGAGWPFAAATAWRWRVAMLGMVGLVAGHLAMQTSRACFRYAADDRNPYAYSPTSPDVEELSALLSKIAEAAPAVRAAPVAVVGRAYWPLPWYLRQFPRVGYWPKMADAVATLPVVLALPAEADAVAAQLRGDYFTMWRGLRHETPVTVFIRRDCWQQYLDQQPP